MTSFVRFLCLLLLSGAGLFAASCGSSSSDPQPAQPVAPATATLSGQITPAGSVTTVTATNATGQAVTATPTATGAYSFPGLTVGAYTLTFAAATGYATPAPQQATLAAAGTVATGTTATLAPATASFSANGVAVLPPYIFSSTLAGDRRILFSVSPGGAPGPTLAIYLQGLTPATGSYPLTNPNSTYKASYTDANYQSYFSSSYTPPVPVAGTLVITSVSANPRRFSGTFNFVGYGTNNAGTYLSAAITNGVFANLPY